MEIAQSGKNTFGVAAAELLRSRAGLQRHVDDVVEHAGFVLHSSTWIARPLVARSVEQVTITIGVILRSVAVVHIEIDDRHPLHPVSGTRVLGGDRGVVKAEAHGGRRFGVMAGRPDGAKRIARSPLATASTAAQMPPTARSAGSPEADFHRRVGIELNMALSWNILENRLDVEGRVHPLDLPQCPLWRFVPMEKSELLRLQSPMIARKRAGASGCQSPIS